MKAVTGVRLELDGGTPDGDGLRYAPGDTLSGRVVCTAGEDLTVYSVAITVRWHTEGVGNPLVGRPAFAERWATEPERQNLVPGQTLTRAFRATLPREPWSFTGKIVSIVWIVDATLAVGSEAEIGTSVPFTLRP